MVWVLVLLESWKDKPSVTREHLDSPASDGVEVHQRYSARQDGLTYLPLHLALSITICGPWRGIVQERWSSKGPCIPRLECSG